MDNKTDSFSIKAELKINSITYPIIEDFEPSTSLDSILSSIEKLKKSSDEFLQIVIDQNKFLLTCGKNKKDDEENLDEIDN